MGIKIFLALHNILHQHIKTQLEQPHAPVRESLASTTVCSGRVFSPKTLDISFLNKDGTYYDWSTRIFSLVYFIRGKLN